MKGEQNFFGQIDKEFKQRWSNSIEPAFNLQEWSEKEQQILFNKHNIYGNKWATISTYLHGRSDNNIKNHFYSTLRKAFRGLNRYIATMKKRGDIKPFKNIVMTKIISLAQRKIQKHQGQQNQEVNNDMDIYSSCAQIKNRLLKFSNKFEKGQETKECIEQLIRDISRVTKIKYKKLKRKITKTIDNENILQENLNEVQVKKNQKQSQHLQNISIKLQKKQSFKKYEISKNVANPDLPTVVKLQEDQPNPYKSIEIPTMSSFSILSSNLPETAYLFSNPQIDMKYVNEFVYLSLHPYMMNNQYYNVYNGQQVYGINNFLFGGNKEMKNQD